MPIIPNVPSLAAVALQAETREHFSYGLRDFLDGFYHDPHSDRLHEEPRRLMKFLDDEGYADAYLAATAEHLAQQYSLPVPVWTKNPHRFLEKPVFAFKTHEGRMFLLVESPTAFRSRNIFISADALTRV